MKQLIFTDGSTAPLGNIYCIGRSYAEHISELGNTPTGEPVVFMKPTTSLTTANILTLPTFSDDVHHEVELVLYIGQDVADDSIPDVSCIAGYGVGLDLTARDMQGNLKAKGLPWTLAKGFRDAAWLSPLTKGAPDLSGGCELNLSVNGDIRQAGNIREMLFDAAYQLAFLHRHFGLRTGDVIYTGTPKGVGKLHSGDKLVASIDDKHYQLSIV